MVFPVPARLYDFAVKRHIEQLVQLTMSSLWELPSLICLLNPPSQFFSLVSLRVKCMLSQMDQKINESRSDLDTMRNETSLFLRPLFESQPRHRRGAGVGLVTLAAVGSFGKDIALGRCDKASPPNIRRLSRYVNTVRDIFQLTRSGRLFSFKTYWLH